jgi:hypothetical protein
MEWIFLGELEYVAASRAFDLSALPRDFGVVEPIFRQTLFTLDDHDVTPFLKIPA